MDRKYHLSSDRKFLSARRGAIHTTNLMWMLPLLDIKDVRSPKELLLMTGGAYKEGTLEFRSLDICLASKNKLAYKQNKTTTTITKQQLF